ncbi:hypothetical protein ACFV6E_40070 [Streptomyces sp. NPDC059785]|uniref:hypothetical protein n=1 Tax=unclassified Streptomyces TaxID=2593676 RepID=UPI0036558471
MLDLARLYDAAGLDPDEPVRRLARSLGFQLAPLVLSVAVAEGHAAGPQTTMFLDRQRRRARVYADVVTLLRDEADPVVLKGPALGALYPPALVRPVGDLDLVIPVEERLWAAALKLMDVYGAAPSVFTLIRDQGAEHCFLGLTWPSDDPLSETDLEVEMSTFAYAGDQAGIPLRVACPPSPALTQLFAVVEERTQSPFTVKSALDCAVVLAAHPGLLTEPRTENAVHEFRIAPELCELLIHSASLTGLSVPARLDALAAQELARRTAAGVTDPPGALPDGRWTAADNVRFGVLLHHARRPGTVRRSGGPAPGGELLHTPVGDYLMLSGTDVDAPDVEAARRMSLAAMSGPTPAPAV